ncbi:toprim domain-containing protein [Ekhidna sp. MALMAid0563]|uniref:toprim domain-containing protein n=1 Tax=Ekhidna sp. MALMAid0563 TaxID=3143937 RepID=UPI0032DF9C08
MDTRDKLKQMPIQDIVSILGGKEQGEGSKGIRYTSPLREEKKGSFWVFPQDNKWHDFGHSGKKGGDAIDLIREYLKVSGHNHTYGDALRFAETQVLNESVDIKHNNKSSFSSKSNSVVIDSIRDELSPSLIDYCKQRGITSRGLIRENIKQVYYKFEKDLNTGEASDKKPFFAIGFANDTDGFEIRNKYVKYASGSKSITSIKGSSNGNSCDVFEGFFDYLSYLERNGLKKPLNDVIVANSANLVGDVIHKINNKGYDQVNVYGDNNVAGQNMLKEIKSNVKAPVNDMSVEYKGFEDLNEYHRQTLNSTRSKSLG